MTDELKAEREALTWQWRFKEQDGDWSPWYWCTASEASALDNRWDVEVCYVG